MRMWMWQPRKLNAGKYAREFNATTLEYNAGLCEVNFILAFCHLRHIKHIKEQAQKSSVFTFF